MYYVYVSSRASTVAPCAHLYLNVFLLGTHIHCELPFHAWPIFGDVMMHTSVIVLSSQNWFRQTDVQAWITYLFSCISASHDCIQIVSLWTWHAGSAWDIDQSKACTALRCFAGWTIRRSDFTAQLWMLDDNNVDMISVKDIMLTTQTPSFSTRPKRISIQVCHLNVLAKSSPLPIHTSPWRHPDCHLHSEHSHEKGTEKTLPRNEESFIVLGGLGRFLPRWFCPWVTIQRCRLTTSTMQVMD